MLDTFIKCSSNEELQIVGIVEEALLKTAWNFAVQLQKWAGALALRHVGE